MEDQAFQELLTDLFCVCRYGVITSINSAGVAMLSGNQTGVEFVGRAFSDFISHEYVDGIDQILDTLAAEKDYFPIKFVQADGQPISATMIVHRTPEHGQGAAVILAQDLTHRTELTQAIKRSEERFRKLVDQTNNLICTCENLEIKFVNTAGRKLMKAGEGKELVGKNVKYLFHPDYQPIFDMDIHDLTSDEPLHAKLSCVDGTVIDVSMSISILDGHVGSEIMVEARDISGHNQAVGALRKTNRDLEERAQQLLRSKEEAERANQTKSHFLSSMSHELRTPLNAIIGFARLLESSKKHPLTARQKGRAGHILDSGNHLLGLIDDILSLTNVGEATFALSIIDIDARQFADDCLNDSKIFSDGTDVSVEDRTDIELPILRIDHRRAKQAILHLLSNAVKYNSEGGMVWLDAERLGAQALRFSVTDTGPGIPEDKHLDLFQPFNRLGAETTGIDGAGVGLALAKKLAEEMGGAVGFKSVPGKGSTFWIEFPTAEEKDG